MSLTEAARCWVRSETTCCRSLAQQSSQADTSVDIKYTSKPWKVTPSQHAHAVKHDTAGADYEFDSPDMKGKGCGSYVLTYLPAKDGDEPKRDGTDSFAYGESPSLALILRFKLHSHLSRA